MGSTSGGVQTMGVGVSLGSTWVDESCNLRRNAAMLIAMGYKDIALQLMLQTPEVAKAFAATQKVDASQVPEVPDAEALEVPSSDPWNTFDGD
jgi:hypothetical protein